MSEDQHDALTDAGINPDQVLVNELLRDLLMRMLQAGDASLALARWFAGAAKRMPPLACETEGFQLLAFVTSSVLEGRKIDARIKVTLDTFEVLTRYLPQFAKRVTVWVALTTRGLHLRPEQYAGYQSVETPLTNPVLLEARPESGRPILVQVSPGQPAFIPLSAGVIALRTLAGDLLTFRPFLGPVQPSKEDAQAPKEGLQLERLAPSEARELLTSIVLRLRLPPAIADKIARLCGYLPLALRASGSLLDVTPDLDPADYAAQLAARG